MTDLHKTIEPVAWAVVGDGKFGEYKLGDEFTKLDAEYWNSRGYELVPLYTAPPSIDALIAEIDELSPVHVNAEYGCTHSDTLIMYHACDIKAILDKYRGRNND